MDGNDSVDFDDLLRVISMWGPVTDCPPSIAEDIDNDCDVGFNDLLLLLAAWGPCVPPRPIRPADHCENAPVVGDGAYDYSTIDASDDGPSLPPECDEGNGRSFRRDVWIRYAASCTGVATASVCDSDYNTRLAVYDVSACPGEILACSDDACGEDGTRSETTFAVVQGEEYLVRIGGRTSTGTGTLVLSCEEGLH